MNIKQFISNYPKFNYLQRCLRRINDSRFVDEVLAIEKDPLRIRILHNGNNNCGKLIYVAQTLGCDGFFAELRFLLAEVYFAETFGFIPVIKIPKESCYYENELVNGSDNPFEYYFVQPSGISVEEAESSYAVVEHNFYQRDYLNSKLNMNSGYMPSEEYFSIVSDLVRKYLHFNEPTKQIIENDINETIKDKKTLGIHVRGADFKRHYNKHPNIVTVDEYLAEAIKVMNENDFEQIFLATDDEEAIEKFSKQFGDKLVYYSDVKRTSGDETVMKSNDDRDLHHYKLGLEVIRDVYTLASCDGIIAGLSNVSIFSRIIKLSKNSDYQIKNYIDKGIKGV